MRSTLCTLVILVLWIPNAPAQSAVLVGLHLNAWEDGEGEHPPSYRTFLIAFRDGKAQLAADLPDLIVPRKDGFWRVGSLHKGPSGGGYQEFIYAGPARSVPNSTSDTKIVGLPNFAPHWLKSVSATLLARQQAPQA